MFEWLDERRSPGLFHEVNQRPLVLIPVPTLDRFTVREHDERRNPTDVVLSDERFVFVDVDRSDRSFVIVRQLVEDGLE